MCNSITKLEVGTSWDKHVLDFGIEMICNYFHVIQIFSFPFFKNIAIIHGNFLSKSCVCNNLIITKGKTAYMSRTASNMQALPQP